MHQFLDKRAISACDPWLMSNNESLAARAERAAQIVRQPHLYKVCEGCESIIMLDAATCPNCHGYRFDLDASRVRVQAEILGKRLPTSVPPSELH
jgi:Zn finger protein HypA/HybF involved in hydrogenase expression